MRKPKRFFVYIMTNGPRDHVLYIGITGTLVRRVFEHKNKLVPGFTSRYEPGTQSPRPTPDPSLRLKNGCAQDDAT